MSNENKKDTIENGAEENHGISNGTCMLAVPECDVKSFLESILAAGNHALVTKQGSGMRHEWRQKADELVKLIDLRTEN